MKKYRIVETSHAEFSIGVFVGKDSQGEEAWVPAATRTFPSFEAAEEGILRIVANRKWYYDDKGNRLPE